MGKLIIANLVLYLVVSFIATFVGLNPKKWPSWLLGGYGFISGSLLGFVVESNSPSWQVGLLSGGLAMYISAMTHWQRRHFGNEASSWLEKYGDEERQPFALLARIIRKLVGK